MEGKCNMHMSEIWHSKKNDCRLSRTQVIKKNKVKLKYGTFVYLINSKDTKSK